MAYSANQKPSGLSTLTSLAADDTIIVGDTSDANEVVKVISKSNFVTDLSGSFATTAQGALADSASQPGHTHAASDVTSGTFDDARIAESNVTQHEGALSITESQVSDLKNYEIKAVANGNLTAVNDTFYVCVSNSTFTDPSPTEGEGFAVLVRNGTATVGGTGYSTAGTIIRRTYHSGSWTNYVYQVSSTFATAAQGALADTALQPAAIGTTVQAYDADLATIAAANNGSVLAATTASFTTADESKLDGIEALADVTDATNVAAAGAIMDGDFSTNGLMKRTGAGTYATATAGTDYIATETDPVVGAVTGIVKANGAGTISAAVAGTDYLAPGAIGSTVQAYDADLTTWAGITPGTGVGTALAVNVGTTGAVVTNGGALGTPSSGTVTNLTGTASININGTVGATAPAAGTFTTVTTTGNIELGHASDTTLARIAAGRASIEGVEIATLTGSQTFTNKTITAPNLTVSNLGNLGATEAIDWSAADIFYGTLDSNVTITHSNEVSGRTITLHLAYDGSAARDITWSNVDRWTDNATGAAPAEPSASGQVLTVTMQFYGTTCVASATGNYAVYA